MVVADGSEYQLVDEPQNEWLFFFNRNVIQQSLYTRLIKIIQWLLEHHKIISRRVNTLTVDIGWKMLNSLLLN